MWLSGVWERGGHFAGGIAPGHQPGDGGTPGERPAASGRTVGRGYRSRRHPTARGDHGPEPGDHSSRRTRDRSRYGGVWQADAPPRRRAQASGKKTPGILKAVDEILQDATAGSPMGGLRWTHKSLRKVAGELRRRGYAIGHVTAGRLLEARDFSLRANRKRLAGKRDPNRNRQFLLLARRRRRFLTHHWPIISVDSKKKELIGNFKNPGRTWRRHARSVLDYDFPSLASGRAYPYGVYDEAANAGYVVVGTSHDTAAFATSAIRSWWLGIGRQRYPQARRLAIDADGGGSNGNRVWGWKLGLQHLADECALTITVGHLPAAASKWNPIEHRMFNLISGNWAGEPL